MPMSKSGFVKNTRLFLGLLAVILILSNMRQKSGKINWCITNPQTRECDSAKINTLGWEDSPHISGDGKKLYFMFITWNMFPSFEGKESYPTGLLRPGHVASPVSPWQEKAGTYVAEKQLDGAWSAPQLVKSDMCCAMTHDGKTFYYQREVQKPGETQNNDIVMISQRTDDGWSEPVNLGPAINTEHTEDNPFISQEYQMLIWASDRPDGYGGNDLWYSLKQPDGTWSPAKNMGTGVNSKGEEDMPWLSVDNKRVYFSKDAHIVMSEFIDGSWAQARALVFPEQPVLAGEPSLTYDEQFLYVNMLNLAWDDVKIAVSKHQPDGTWSRLMPVD